MSLAAGRAGIAMSDEKGEPMTQEIAKSQVDAKAALALAVDQNTGLDLMTLATVMVQSGFFPNAESVAQGVVKILAGRELGFPAIASMRHIYVHNGHIGLQATLIATQIRRSGTYDYRIAESSDTKCEIEFLRKVDNQWRPEGKASFTIEEAKRAGLVKDKSAWQTYPSDLLFARAMTRGQRRFCPDVFGQTVYSEEEVREIADAEPMPAPDLETRMAELMPREKSPVMVVGDPGGVVIDHARAIKDVEEGHAKMPPEAKAEAAAILSAIEAIGEVMEPAPQPKKTTFTVGSHVFETNGINRAQMMELFKLYPRVAKKYGQEKAADVLKNEFGLEHRADLTEEQAERYTIRLKEMLDG